ncbi:receptor-type tyrosine-protein phosphatase H [Prionailurus iriomotensis]
MNSSCEQDRVSVKLVTFGPPWSEDTSRRSPPPASQVSNPVTDQGTQDHTMSSVILMWTAPLGPDHPPYTYGVQCCEPDFASEILNISGTWVMVGGLERRAWYTFTIQERRSGVCSDTQVFDLPTGHLQGQQDPQGHQTNHTGRTNDSWYEVQTLEPGTLYTFSVWADRNNVTGYEQSLLASTGGWPDSGLTIQDLLCAFMAEAAGKRPLTQAIWVGQCEGTREGRPHGRPERRGRSAGVRRVACAAGQGPGRLAPSPGRNLTAEDRTPSSITLQWQTPRGLDRRHHTPWGLWSGRDGGTEAPRTTDTSFTVDGLGPRSPHESSVWVQQDETNSSKQTLQNSTGPYAVRNLKVEAQTTSSVTLIWEEPGDPDFQNYVYRIQWNGSEAQNTTNTSFVVDGLQPGSLYEFAVRAEKNGVASNATICNATTVPNAVTSLSVQKQTNSSITLSWTAPPDPDHPLYTYGVSWVKESTSAISIRNTTDTGIILTELEAGSLYIITVWAERNEVSSDNRTLTGATAPNTVMDLHKENQTSNSIILRWKVPTDPHSQLYTYWVQWTPGGHPQGQQDPQGHQTNHTGRTNDSWYEVQTLEPGTLYTFSVWADRNNVTGYEQSLLASTAPSPVTITSCISTSGGHGVILTWSCPMGGYEAFELQVGGQRDCQNGSSCGRGVSVWDLQPAQSYPATVTTIWDGMRAPSAPVTCHTENAGVIAGAIVGVVLFLILVGLLIFFLKKRHKKSQRKPAPKVLGSRCDKGNRSQEGSPHLLENIPAQDFAAHVRKNEKDANSGFAVEYQRLALEGTKQSQMVASALENSAKNRYRNVLPYDWSRVSLKPQQEEPGSDYINASFIPGLWGPREFIAAQGPLPQTVADFWRLVWEQQSRTLVMLTNCVESGRVKCEYYWPLDAQPCTYGHLQVALEGEKVLENWTVRDLRVRHIQEQRTLRVRQFHYMTWPDHGVPHSPDPLLAFWKMVRQWLDQTVEGGPPIVHCSAGVGRTGTFIALDVLLRQLERERFVGAFSYVRKMRESRPLMLQTEAQYVFLHQCILQGLQQSPLAPAEKGASYVNPLYENV